MQSFFQDELAKLRKRIIKMFMLVETQIEKSIQSVTMADFEIGETARQNENRIDKLDIKIDKLCQRIFALAQPVATDLRFIMSSLRIGNEIERIGDIALDVIGRSEVVRPYQGILEEYKVIGIFGDIHRLASGCAEAYTNNNNELAREIITGCRQAEENCKQAFNDVIGRMTEKSEVILIATDLILIIRDLERIANHLENIADSVTFIVEGKRVRHQQHPQ
jgi:phosphate transport system protein